MDELFGVGASAVSGGLLGVIGAGIGRGLGFLEQRASFAQERARWAHELKLHELQMQAKAAETESELAVMAAQGSYQGLTASLEAEAKIAASYKWVEAVRALVRPVLTPMLWLMYLAVFQMVASGNAARYLSPEAADDLVGYLVANVAFAATAATLWWFGDRAPRPKALREG